MVETSFILFTCILCKYILIHIHVLKPYINCIDFNNIIYFNMYKMMANLCIVSQVFLLGSLCVVSTVEILVDSLVDRFYNILIS